MSGASSEVILEDPDLDELDAAQLKKWYLRENSSRTKKNLQNEKLSKNNQMFFDFGVVNFTTSKSIEVPPLSHEVKSGEKNQYENKKFHKNSIKQSELIQHEDTTKSNIVCHIPDVNPKYGKLIGPTHNYKCSLCGKIFSKMDKFKIHIISVHEHRLQYTCTICNCDLSSNKELFHHISIAHEGKKQPNAICIKPFRYSIYVYVDSKLLALVVCFAKPVKTSLSTV